MENGEIVRVHKTYVKRFQNRVEEVALHLRGTADSHASSPPSYIPPCVYWSGEDKDRFFHALSVHSRLRPDLIAQDIPGKTASDVCIYLDLLADAAAKTPKKFNRTAFPRALEVSDDWIDFEETQARAMAASETTWEAHQRKSQRKAELRFERHASRRKRKEWLGDAGNECEENTKRVDAVFNEIRTKREVEWEKEDYMADLGSAHLKVIDGILRKAEEAFVSALSGFGRVRNEDENCVDSTVPRNAEASVGKFTPLPLAGDSVTQDMPLTDQDPIRNDSGQIAEGGIPDHTDTEEPSVELANLSPRSRRRHQKRLYMRRKRAAQSGKEACMAATRLKPGRKTNKKLLHALSRAKKQQAVDDNNAVMVMGEEVNLDDASFTIPMHEDQKGEIIDVFEGKEETEISLGIEREEVFGKSQSPTLDELEAELAKFHRSIGGQTLPYKIKEDLLALGFDGQTLERECFGLFHLSRLADLMSLHPSLQECDADTAIGISGNLIKLLHAEVVCFVTDLIHRSIAIHEQERLSKEHARVWRLEGELIKVRTVHHALETKGSMKDKKEHFAPLVDRLAFLYEDGETKKQAEVDTVQQLSNRSDYEYDDTADEDADSDSGDTTTGHESGMDEDDQELSIHNPEPLVALHRGIYAPFLWHSTLDHQCPIPFTSLKDGIAPNASIGEILDISNEAGLVDELVEEEELDAVDVAAAKEAEEELWLEFGLREKVDEGASEPQDQMELERRGENATPVQPSTPRKRRRGAKFGSSKRFKSSIYIEDSE